MIKFSNEQAISRTAIPTPSLRDFAVADLPNEQQVCFLYNHNGTLTREEIDRLAEHPEIDTIKVMGLKQDTFEYLISSYGRQLRRIHFFKNPLVQDWSMLSELPDLEWLYWYWNQRITSLWDMSENRSLVALHIADFTRLHDLERIEKAESLRMLFIGDHFSSTTCVHSLMPLADTAIEHLYWVGKRIDDQDCSFLPQMKSLKTFHCPLNCFTTEQCAWIAANCPHADCRISHPYEIWDRPDGTKEAAIIGKKKPVLKICQENEERIRKYEKRFEELKFALAGVPYHQAFRD